MKSPIRRCLICGEPIKDNEEIATIMSGTFDEGNNTINPIKGVYVFHPHCFKEIAGEEYYPIYQDTMQ